VILSALLATLSLAPVKTELRDGRLYRAGVPYQIKGAGGGRSTELLAQYGGNSARTWGADGALAVLDEAQKHGVTVTVGIWLGHKEQGFKYDDPQQVAKQLADAKAAVSKLKDHPALLMWGIGNEMEGYDAGGDPLVWKAVEEIAREIKKLDPNHPTMTVTAEIGGERVASINKYCPSIDIHGINSYGGAPSLGERYGKAGGKKPYVITEFGPLGQWEVGKTRWGAPIEMTSTEKAAFYQRSYEANAKNPLCLGSYAFLWGNKQEATSTWFGMFLQDGSRLAAVDTMRKLWTGSFPKNRAPAVESLSLDTKPQLQPNQTIEVHLKTSDPEGDILSASWYVQSEQPKPGVGGQNESIPELAKGSVITSSLTGATIKAPSEKGAYRIFVIVKDPHGGAATANLPILVE
jgi:hypothetical protein